MRVRWVSMVALAVSVGVLMVSAAAAAAATPYTALGDSYTSGDGTGVYTPASGACLQSPLAYPPLVAKAEGYDLTFAACSGATTQTLISNQLGSLNDGTGLVSVQIGGNDAGFGNVMVACAFFDVGCSAAIQLADGFIQNVLPGRLDTTYSDITNAAPNAKVVVLGYPRLFNPGGRTCGASLLTSWHERALNRTADMLDNVIAQAAAAHGFAYVDPRAAYWTHEICSPHAWLNNLTVANPIASFHPNAGGEAAFAQLVEGAL